MKKSKIIVPAMCLIAFTSFASIAGSVAWFTASRQVSLGAGTYTVVKTTTNLKASLAEGVGTDVNKVGNAITLETGASLTDGSFDHNHGVFTTPDENGTARSSTVPQFAIGDTGWEGKLVRKTYETTKKVYTAATFTITFTMNFGAISGDYGLFLDCTRSSFTGAADPANDTTAKGFRMAFYPQPVTEDAAPVTRGVSKVFADLQDDAECKFVAKSNGESLAGTAYAGDLMDKDSDAAAPIDNATRDQATGQVNYLGYFKYKTSAEVQLKFVVVAWFEGTDLNIVNRASADEYQSVATSLTFIAEPIAADA